MSTSEPPAKKARQESIDQALARLSMEIAPGRIQDTQVINKIATRLSEKDGPVCHFVTDGNIKFRHEGRDDASPPILFLTNFTDLVNALNSKVLLFCQASGSGKTVELAGSAVSRGAHLSLVCRMDSDPSNANYESAEDRNEALLPVLKKKAAFMLKRCTPLQELCRVATESGERLELVFAIDEASNCPLLVRSIISEKIYAGDFVARGLGLDPSKVKVLFSIAGTGAATGSVGSNTANFAFFKPTAVTFPAQIFNFHMQNVRINFPRDDGKEDKSMYEKFQTSYPILGTLIKNGRMSSIAARHISKLFDEYKLVHGGTEIPMSLNEPRVVDDTIHRYVNSNGMQNLLTDTPKRYVTASVALAVLLFQWGSHGVEHQLPTDENDFLKTMQSMGVGLEFNDAVESEFPGDSAIRSIVTRYGLLQPQDKVFLKGDAADNILEMTSDQQLVAISLLGVDLSKLLEASPDGFEFLSTHIVKCALAASSVIKGESRPTVQDALRKIGFVFDEYATSKVVKEEWDLLAESYVVANFWPARELPLAGMTRQMLVELELFEGEDGEDLVRIEKDAFNTLKAMHHQQQLHPIEIIKLKNSRLPFICIPSTWINYGASPLADGFITFYIARATDVLRYTIMNQAKDYHNETKLKTKKLEDHAGRCADPSLNGMFGGLRLLCVSGDEDVVTAKRKCKERSFMPYASNRGAILEELLGELAMQRNRRVQAEAMGVFVNSKGNVKHFD